MQQTEEKIRLEKLTMRGLLTLSSDDLQDLKDKAWLEFKKIDNALQVVKDLETDEE